MQHISKSIRPRQWEENKTGSRKKDKSSLVSHYGKHSHTTSSFSQYRRDPDEVLKLIAILLGEGSRCWCRKLTHKDCFLLWATAQIPWSPSVAFHSWRSLWSILSHGTWREREDALWFCSESDQQLFTSYGVTALQVRTYTGHVSAI